ncbi:response regulator [Paraburkholderia terrae]|uniref:response regulator n=1 Tax=Paraburkholderia terrae TaxID=311230 RepID=UPI00204ED1FC|nr:response regulator [Paraburkholderia terrae]BDC42982.1 response regulator [Paraburkholderia terrae]
MNIDEITKLIDSLSKFVSALAWPTLVAFLLVRFEPALKNFLQSLGELSFKGAGFEASVKRKQVEATAALVAAAAHRPDSEKPQLAANEAKEAVNLVQDEVTPRVLRKASRSTILWVDDRPENNSYERQSLEALGITFVLARSTDEALEKSKPGKFNAIISDMGRPPDPRAGYTLLDKLRASGDQTPYIIYAGSNSTEHRTEARKHGALGCTNRPPELFEYVLQALRAAA